MADKKVFSLEPVSEDFFQEFTDAGCLVEIDCGFCGRVHFADPSCTYGDYEEGRFDELIKKMNEEPDNYFLYNYSISYGNLAGRTFIPECKCNGGRPYEDFIGTNMPRITDYYKRLLANQRSETELMEKQLENL